MNIILIYFALKYKGDWDKIFKALEEKEKVSIKELNETEQLVKDEGWDIITILDINYPNKLKESYKPPFIIFMKGNKKLLKNKFMCATGNQVDEITEKRIVKFIPEINKRYNLVTANYKGVDKLLIEKTKSPTLYVGAEGVDKSTFTPRKGDLMISEYPFGTHATKESYRRRNRLIAAFGTSLVLFSSLKDGPINHLVTNFLNLGRDVYAFPGDGSDTDGNSELIKQGAQLITKIKDLSH